MQLEGSQHLRDMEKYKILVKKLREENALQGTQVLFSLYESIKNLRLYKLHYMSLYNSQTMIIKDDL